MKNLEELARKEKHLKTIKNTIRDLKGSLEIIESSKLDLDKEVLKKELKILEKTKQKLEKQLEEK